MGDDEARIAMAALAAVSARMRRLGVLGVRFAAERWRDTDHTLLVQVQEGFFQTAGLHGVKKAVRSGGLRGSLNVLEIDAATEAALRGEPDAYPRLWPPSKMKSEAAPRAAAAETEWALFLDRLEGLERDALSAASATGGGSDVPQREAVERDIRSLILGANDIKAVP